MNCRKTYDAGVKDYRETYWMPDYEPSATDLLACFKITPQPGVPREEAAAAVLVSLDRVDPDIAARVAPALKARAPQ